MAVPGGQYKYVVMQNSATATGNGTAVKVTDEAGANSTIVIQVEGISGDTITFEGTIDGSTWYGIIFSNLTSAATGTTSTADGLYRATVTGLLQVRARISTYSAGTIICTGVLTA